jgi:hypothetical protein
MKQPKSPDPSLSKSKKLPQSNQVLRQFFLCRIKQTEAQQKIITSNPETITITPATFVE